MLKKPFQVLLVCIVVLAVYYPTIFAEVCLLDDVDMLNNLLNTQEFDIKGLFFPGSAEGGYYRPLIGLSFYLDRFIWFLSPEIMHFENILLHLLNALLVLGIGWQLWRRQSEDSLVPLLAALLFALHPVNTESVNWISGRTDILAGVFVFAAALVITSERGIRPLGVIAAMLLLMIGGLAKETAFAFLPGCYFLLWGEHAPTELVANEDQALCRLKIFSISTALALSAALFMYNYWLVLAIIAGSLPVFAKERGWSTVTLLGNSRYALILSSMLVAGCLLFWIMRRLAFSSDMPRIASALKLLVADPNITFHYFLGGIGFYVKKFLWPFPLNFAIREIDPLYSLFGVVLLLFCVYLLVHRSVSASLILAGFCMILPALPLVLGRIAWTPYAERYVYLAVPFWTLAIGYVANPLLQKRGVGIIVCCMLLFFAVATLQRNLVWQRNLTLFGDMVEKSPTFKPARGLYMTALYQLKRYDEAAAQYYQAQNLPSVMYEEQYDLLMAQMLAEQQKFAEAERVYSKAIEKTGGKNASVLKAAVSFYQAERHRWATQEERHAATEKLLTHTRMLETVDQSPWTLYRVGQVYLEAGESRQARVVLQRALERLERADPLRPTVTRLLQQLAKGR